MNSNKFSNTYNSYNHIYLGNQKSRVIFWFYGLILSFGIILFLPWTQNIKSTGSVTSLKQEQRPQKINSPIPGRISKWWIKEGDHVKKGDTILQLTEIKEDYLDPNLIGRTREQVNAKKGTIEAYKGKIATAGSQIDALNNGKRLKISQLENKLRQLNFKLKSEQADFKAISNEYILAKDQYERQQKMYNEGLVSTTQLQQRNLSFQNATAKMTSADNKISQTQQEIINIEIEKNSVEQDYNEKISKAEGEQFQGQSQIATGEGEIAKLENQVTNYSIRNGMYFVLAPQDGQIVQANKSGIGEVLKEGETITIIVPESKDFAVEIYIRPVDLPLINLNQKVRFQFDGFPAIVFSGWPNASYGTFGGRVVAFENTISPNGMFRVLVAEDKEDRHWPYELKIGSGAKGISFLKDVKVWYEIWRNINGFPPDYYQNSNDVETSKKK